eukprot:TRINITY_DN40086_c0_g1_i1.p1 TRINITY_DN40086_c0_g1~~TRINITY_DN40086_c0_g1_i1.p1  ORF type:complete len:150 (-),score=24.32 TRINITY_DN40086_c0_g1_i1:76-504(-)
MWHENGLILLLLLPLISSQINFEDTQNNTTVTSSSKGNETAGCSVATSESGGLGQYIFTLRELIQPTKTTQSCKTQESICNPLQCCFSEHSTSSRPGYNGTCILNDWVLPLAGGLVLALFFSLCLCCCCYCCSRKKKQEYDL